MARVEEIEDHWKDWKLRTWDTKKIVFTEKSGLEFISAVKDQ
jgi:hypothetical protein